MVALPPYVHPLEQRGDALPTAFTFPFHYTPHPLCVRAAAIVQQHLQETGIREGKMFGVLVARTKPAQEMQAALANAEQLVFLAAYSGQLRGSYTHPWFVPPVVDYLRPDSHFQQEQAAIVDLTRRMEALSASSELRDARERLATLLQQRDAAVAAAKQASDRSKAMPHDPGDADYIRLRQHLKADIHRAKQLHSDAIAAIEQQLQAHHTMRRALFEERRRRSEALQQWLFEQFAMLNALGERKNLIEIWNAREATLSPTASSAAPTVSSSARVLIPSGAGECCAPKLLQAAYELGLQPLAMGEFWWGPSNPMRYRQPGAFFPACHSKCRPILSHMLRGLRVEADPTGHYEQALRPVRILWEDDQLAVIEKPEGWCSIPGRSDQANLFDEALRLWPGIEGSVIVHRLDQDTSGVMVLAKTPRTHRALSQQFERREVEKQYIALLEAPVAQREGTLSLPLGPDLDDMPRRCVDFAHGKEAVTRYVVLGTEVRNGQTVKRIAFYPQTGRTHQLRVHASSPQGLNAPILGDRLYGHLADRLYLHAAQLTFTHPVSGERLHFELPCPF